VDVIVLEYDDNLREHGRRDGGQQILEAWSAIETACNVPRGDLKRSKRAAFRQVEFFS